MPAPPLDTQTLTKTLSELVAIKSLSGEEKPMAEYIEAWLKRVGYKVDRDEQDNVVAVLDPEIPGLPEVNTLHISGHTDTVPPVEGWKSDPFTPLIEGVGEERKLIGLGSCDMKGGLTSMLYLATQFAQRTQRFKHLRVVFSFTVCEENSALAKKNGVHAVLKKYPGRWAITTEASCDETGPTLTLGCQGHALARIGLRGRSAHSASPELGFNAIHAAGTVIERVARQHSAFLPLPIYGTVQALAAVAVTRISGGQAHNMVPEKCELTISRRLVPGEGPNEVKRECEAWTAGLLQQGIEVTTKVDCDAPGCVVNTDGPLFLAACAAARKLHGTARFSWNRARTDMVLFKNAGMDVLNIGPGHFGQAHMAGEAMRVTDLPRVSALLYQVCENLDIELAVKP
jgi:acetylornithine deacetylase/succinyl-diaminopimelate desuccinylase-like protein